MTIERRTVHYSGRVQGVGFRWRARHALEPLGLGGYVCNLRDGRVELVLEGAARDIDAALGVVRNALGPLIDGEDQRTSPATGEFEGFEIRR